MYIHIYIGEDRGGLWRHKQPPVSLPNSTQSTRDPDLESKYNSTALADLYTEISPAGHEPIWLKLIRPKAHNIALSNMFVKPYKV